MKFSIILGTRPEVIKLAPVIRELEKRNIETDLIHTGQHNLIDLSSDLNLRYPDVILDIPPMSTGKFKGNLLKGIFMASRWSLITTKKIMNYLSKSKPDALFYEGDTLAIACSSLASKFLRKKPITGHVEAGLRSNHILSPFPEELSRKIADRLSDLLFVPTEEAKNNLEKEKIDMTKVYITGNTIVDAVFENLEIIDKINFDIPNDDYCLVMVHRLENIHSKKNLLNLLKILENINKKIIFIGHDSTMQKLNDFNLKKRLNKIKNLKTYPLLSYIKFLKILVNSEFIITDSGGLQEETAVLNIPCLVWRTNTERPEAIKAGTSVLVGCDPKLTMSYIKDIENKGEFFRKVKKAKNPFGDGKASKRIIDITLSNL